MMISKSAKTLSCVLLLGSVLCCAQNDGSVKDLRPVLPEDLMLLPNEEKQITLKVKGDDGKPIEYYLTDFSTDPLPFKGTAVPKDGKIVIPLKLPRGFYELIFPVCKQRIGISVQPRQTEDDPYWAVNAHFQGKAPIDNVRRKSRNYMEGAFEDIAMIESYCKILHDAGIRHCREFTGFVFRSKYEGHMNHNVERVETICELFRKYQLRGLFNYNLFPPYLGAGSFKDKPARDLPRLKHVRHFDVMEKPFKYMLEKEATFTSGLQVYNEDDMPKSKTPQDMVTSLFWAVRYWLNELGYSYPLVGSAICGIGIEGMFPSAIWQLYRDSGYLDCINVFAMHYYLSSEKFRKALEYNLSMLMKYTEPPYPAMWITECNNWFYISGLRSSIREDKNMANITVRNAVHAKACGVERFFVFCLTFMDEAATGKNFGMFDFFQTPHRLWSAYATAAAELRNSRYIGDLDPVAGFDPIHVFEKNGERIAILSSAKEPQVDFRKFQADSMLHIDGADAKEGTVKLYGGIGYLKLGKSAKINVETTAMKFNRQFAEKRQIHLKAYPVVLRHHFEDFDRSMEAYFVPAPKFTLKVTAFNFAEQEKEIGLVLSCNGKELPAQIAQIPANGKKELSWELDMADAVMADIVIRDAKGNASSLAMRYRRSGEKLKELPGASDPGNWKKNCLGNQMTIEYDKSENAMLFRADMSGHKVRYRWFFPQYNFPRGGKPRHEAELFFDLKPGKGSERPAVYILQKEPPFKYSDRPELVKELPDGWKTYRLRLLFPEIITALQFGYGMNPEQAEFRIRNIRTK